MVESLAHTGGMLVQVQQRHPYGYLVQWLEFSAHNRVDIGSSPVVSTIICT